MATGRSVTVLAGLCVLFVTAARMRRWLSGRIGRGRVAVGVAAASVVTGLFWLLWPSAE